MPQVLRLALALGLACSPVFLAACATRGGGHDEAPPPTKDPTLGAAIVYLLNPQFTPGYVQALGIRADGSRDPARQSMPYHDDPAPHHVFCYLSSNFCMIPDLAPGRYALSGFDWSDRHGLGYVFTAADKAPRDALTFEVRRGQVVYAGAVSWSDDARLLRSRGRVAEDGRKDVFSYQRNDSLDERTALQMTLESSAFRREYAAWIPTIETRVKELAKLPGPKPLFRSDLGRYRYREGSKEKEDPDEPGLKPEHPDDGVAIVVLHSTEGDAWRLKTAPLKFDNREDRDREQSLAQSSDQHSGACYYNSQICILVDLAPGRYVLESFHSNSGQYVLADAGSDPVAGDSVIFTVAPHSATWVGAYFWGGTEHHLFSRDKFGMVPVDGVDETFALRELLATESFRHHYPAWVPMVERRLLRAGRGSTASAKGAPAESETGTNKKTKMPKPKAHKKPASTTPAAAAIGATSRPA